MFIIISYQNKSLPIEKNWSKFWFLCVFSYPDGFSAFKILISYDMNKDDKGAKIKNRIGERPQATTRQITFSLSLPEWQKWQYDVNHCSEKYVIFLLFNKTYSSELKISYVHSKFTNYLWQNDYQLNDFGSRILNQSKITNAQWTGTTQPFDPGQWLPITVILCLCKRHVFISTRKVYWWSSAVNIQLDLNRNLDFWRRICRHF